MHSLQGTLMAVAWLWMAGLSWAADSPEQFESLVGAVLSAKCVACHQPGHAEGGLDLTTRAGLLRGGEMGAGIVPGRPDESPVYTRTVAPAGKQPEMPEKGEPLTAQEAIMLRTWIEQGAVWPADLVLKEKAKADSSWWSLRPLEAIRSPSPRPAAIDEFILAKLTEHGLTLNPPADRRALIRRATYDLTGLPPAPEEVEAFVNDPDPQAYEKWIDRLLASPRYGERWGRHWLDVVRFGESIGYERNVIVDDIWPFRDYVIRSINEDKPFDQFLREHLAGDILGSDDPDVAVGSAFLVAGPYDDVGNQDPVQAAQIRANTLDEIIRATGEAFLGMTIGCARCHDHKFDPITQEDYYGLYATFSAIRHGSVPLATSAAQAERTARLEPLQKSRAELEKSLADLDAAILKRGREQQTAYEATWHRPPVDRTGTEDRFEPVMVKYVRLVCEAQDGNPAIATGFGIDEFEVWSAGDEPSNVALDRHGGRASGRARSIEDFPGA
ncbi:MAG: DUF1549 domain-containing protein [Pirellulaceae bacterium]